MSDRAPRRRRARRPATTRATVLTALLGVLAASLLAVAASPTYAGGESEPNPRPVVATHPALARASAVMTGSTAGDDEATLALRDLFRARPSLGPAEAEQAGRLLARPTDGARDPYGDGYRVPSATLCSRVVCVHYARRGEDAPPNRAWAQRVLNVMDQVWRHHVGRLGYRTPPSDGARGGDGRFDVYLSELGDQGLYGYCAPERRLGRYPRRTTSFCVLDNDFARAQFGRAPMDTLRVTAAHEFFHAIQFGYDYQEDPWFLESTATWMEERFADDVNDNRIYLRYGQMTRPNLPLDLFDAAGYAHYGNWTFWEYLTRRYGDGLVRRVLQRIGTGGGAPNEYSVQALDHVLSRKGGLAKNYAAFAAGNLVPAKTYREGARMPTAPVVGGVKLHRDRPAARRATRVRHLASKSYLVRPDKSFRSRSWKLLVDVDGPAAASSPAVRVGVVRADGSVGQRAVRLDARGDGRLVVGFGRSRIKYVTITLANVSTRYTCLRGTTYACQGNPRDDNRRFVVGVRAFRR